MKIKLIKLGVGGMNSEISWFDDEVIVDESEIGFKMSEKEMEGGGDEGVLFWMIREDSEYFGLSGEEFIEKEIDCVLSEKYEYEFKLDEYGDEVDKLSEKYFGVDL